jgi:hypothetical protein
MVIKIFDAERTGKRAGDRDWREKQAAGRSKKRDRKIH